MLSDPKYRPVRLAITPLVQSAAEKMVSGVTNSISLRKDKKAPRVKRTADDDAADDTLLSQTLLRKGRKIALESRLAAEPHLAPFAAALSRDGCVSGVDTGALASASTLGSLHTPAHCHICRLPYTSVHAFYHRLCPACGDFNYTKRHQTADLTGYTAVVTGGRIKIGYRTVLKLLRAGCTVVTTTRFPHDAALRFAAEADSAVWFSHLSIIRLDLRDIRAVQTFAAFLLDKFDRIDILINNAAQTIWRPDAFYRHLLPVEGTPVPLLASPLAAPMLAHDASFLTLLDVPAPAPDALVPLCADAALFPAGVTDMHGQQLDLRPLTTSWTLTLPQVPVPELAEVMAVNAMAPFVLCSALQPALQSPFLSNGSIIRRPAFIVNVSSMEGKFNRFKTCDHPHTNMAKAALNMLTRTSAKEYATTSNIFMTAVDTGWVTDEQPVGVRAAGSTFQTPLDEEDGAARVLDPIFSFVNNPTGSPLHGVFLKDYTHSTW